MQLNELSKALHADAELDRVTYLVTSVLDKVARVRGRRSGAARPRGAARAIVVRRGRRARPRSPSCSARWPGWSSSVRSSTGAPSCRTEGAVRRGGGRPAAKWTVLVADVSTIAARGRLPVRRLARPERVRREATRGCCRRRRRTRRWRSRRSRAYARLRGDLDKRRRRRCRRWPTRRSGRKQGHADRVMDYAVAIGEEMGLSVDEIELLRFAGLLHDIGKIGVAEDILLKPRALTRRGDGRGAAALGDRRDHRRADGVPRRRSPRSSSTTTSAGTATGYPEGLAGEEIPLEARILAVADAYDAMTCERSVQQGAAARDRAHRARAAARARSSTPRSSRRSSAMLDQRRGRVRPTGHVRREPRGARTCPA